MNSTPVSAALGSCIILSTIHQQVGYAPYPQTPLFLNSLSTAFGKLPLQSGTTTLLTGMPRSGTTLVCSLLNEVDDTLALVEPIRFERLGDRTAAVAQVEAFVLETRRLALSEGVVITKHIGGMIPDNTAEPPGASGLRRVLEERGRIPVAKRLGERFHLVIKHPAEFTALWQPLAERFRLFATVRHPLAVLASWQTVDMPINRGRMPMAEAFLPELTRKLDALSDPLDRQVALIKWQLETYAQFPKERVLRYEDSLRDPSRRLLPLSGKTGAIRSRPEPVVPQTRYADVDFKRIAHALRALAPLATLFYPDFLASLDAHVA